jgi:hypothetical protein
MAATPYRTDLESYILSLVGWAANGNPTELLYFRWVSLG